MRSACYVSIRHPMFAKRLFSSVSSLGPLPADLVAALPPFTFAKLFSNTFQAYAIHQQETYFERELLPNRQKCTKYVNMVLNPKYGFELATSRFTKTTFSGSITKPFYETDVEFHKKGFILKERAAYTRHKECKYCTVWKYTARLTLPDKTVVEHKEEYCGQMLLAAYDVPKPLWQLFKEVRDEFEKISELK